MNYVLLRCGGTVKKRAPKESGVLHSRCDDDDYGSDICDVRAAVRVRLFNYHVNERALNTRKLHVSFFHEFRHQSELLPFLPLILSLYAVHFFFRFKFFFAQPF